MDITIADDCTLQASIDGIFGQPDTVVVNTTYKDGNSTIIDIVGHPVFGDTTITVTDTGDITLAGTGLHQGINEVSGTGTVTTTQILLQAVLHGGPFKEDIELNRVVPDTPTPTPTPVPTAAVWSDGNCSGGANPVDSLLTLRFDAGLSANTGDCPEMGQVVEVANASPHLWGDVDCSGEINPIDSLKILRVDAGLGVTPVAGCPAQR